MNQLQILESIEKLAQDRRKGVEKQDLTMFEVQIPNMASDFNFTNQGSQYTRKVVKDFSLFGGTSYTTQRIAAYKRYDVPEIPLDLRGIDGTALSPSSVMKMSDGELSAFYDVASAQINLAMEDIQGKFDTHTEGESNRLVALIGKYEKERMEGEAKLDTTYFSAPLIPGLPINLMTIAKIGLSMAVPGIGGVLAGAALDMANNVAGGMKFSQALGGVALSVASGAIGQIDFGLGGSLLGTMGQSFLSTTASGFVGSQGQRILEGKSLSWGAAWDGLKSSAIKGVASAAASGVAYGIKSWGDGKMEEIQKADPITGTGVNTGQFAMQGQSWFSNFSANLVSQSINTAGNYAAFKLVDEDRVVDRKSVV